MNTLTARKWDGWKQSQSMKELLHLIGNPAFLALLGTIFGGVGLKVVENLLNKSKTREDIAASLRKELREDVGTMRKELRTLETELDKWKQKYYQLLEQYYYKNKDPNEP